MADATGVVWAVALFAPARQTVVGLQRVGSAEDLLPFEPTGPK